jgi:hypothetical protein
MKLLITILAVTALLSASVLSLPVFAESTVLHGFDKEACYAKCACATGLFTACAECKAACDRTFWRVWERDMGDDATSKRGGKKSQ